MSVRCPGESNVTQCSLFSGQFAFIASCDGYIHICKMKTSPIVFVEVTNRRFTNLATSASYEEVKTRLFQENYVVSVLRSTVTSSNYFTIINWPSRSKLHINFTVCTLFSTIFSCTCIISTFIFSSFFSCTTTWKIHHIS